MEKAYDMKDLMNRMKVKGLDLAEDALVMAVGEIFDWAEASAKISPTPYDDMGLIILPKLKELALEAVDKIDGEVG